MTQVAINRPCTHVRRSVLGKLWAALSMMRQRRRLAQLDDRALQDIGLTRTEAETEARRAIWDAPEIWHK